MIETEKEEERARENTAAAPHVESGAGGAVGPVGEERIPGFSVHLDNFEGPFDLLLALIARHKMDVTEVALSVVTDEYIAHI